MLAACFMDARTIRSAYGCKEKNRELSALELNTVELFPEKIAMTEDYGRAVHEQKMAANKKVKDKGIFRKKLYKSESLHFQPSFFFLFTT